MGLTGVLIVVAVLAVIVAIGLLAPGPDDGLDS